MLSQRIVCAVLTVLFLMWPDSVESQKRKRRHMKRKKPSITQTMTDSAGGIQAGRDVIINPRPTPPSQPGIQRVVLRTMGNVNLEYLPEIKKYGIKVEMVLDNDSIPDAELQNISGQVWTESKYLIATIKRTKFDYPW